MSGGALCARQVMGRGREGRERSRGKTGRFELESDGDQRDAGSGETKKKLRVGRGALRMEGTGAGRSF